MRSVTTKHNKQLRQRLAVAFAADFLDEADKGTPQFGVTDLHERSDQFQSIGLGKKVGDVGGKWRLATSL
jgi:hypothetical protein